MTSYPFYDVAVIGGGVSGAIAALAAARNGASTLLIEEHGFLGGTLTAMGVGPMMSFHNDDGVQVVKGFAEELVQRLMARGASPGHVADTTTYCSTVTPFDSEELKIELEALLEEAGVAILYHTQLAQVRAEAGQIAEVLVCNKAGLSPVRATLFIDATGDADLAAEAGVPFQYGREGDGAIQPMTMNLKLANVDTAAIRRYARENPSEFEWEQGEEAGLSRLGEPGRLSLAGYFSLWNRAREEGSVSIPRDRILLFETPTPGVVIINTSRILGLKPTDPFDLSAAERIGRRQCRELFHFLRSRCPGFENAIRMDLAAKVGVRESRHVRGLYTLTEADLLNETAFEDAIACGGYPIDIHSPDGSKTHTHRRQRAITYQIPLRCLQVASPGNLIVVGRCISATHEAAAAIRVTPIAMAIGQAGGTLAALAIASGKPPATIAPNEVRTCLRAQGAWLPG